MAGLQAAHPGRGVQDLQAASRRPLERAARICAGPLWSPVSASTPRPLHELVGARLAVYVERVA